jgi:hypothetical protein
MAYIHAFALFTTFLFIYMWFLASTDHKAHNSVDKMIHALECYEEEEQWHEDFDAMVFEV